MWYLFHIVINCFSLSYSGYLELKKINNRKKYTKYLLCNNLDQEPSFMFRAKKTISMHEFWLCTSFQVWKNDRDFGVDVNKKEQTLWAFPIFTVSSKTNLNITSSSSWRKLADCFQGQSNIFRTKLLHSIKEISGNVQLVAEHSFWYLYFIYFFTLKPFGRKIGNMQVNNTNFSFLVVTRTYMVLP